MKMQIPTVSRCCCCVQLRTAGLIFGVLAIISFAYDIYDDNILWKQIYFGEQNALNFHNHDTSMIS